MDVPTTLRRRFPSLPAAPRPWSRRRPRSRAPRGTRPGTSARAVGPRAAPQRRAALGRELLARAARDLEDALGGLLEESQIFTVELRELEGVALFSCFCIIGECGRVLVHSSSKTTSRPSSFAHMKAWSLKSGPPRRRAAGRRRGRACRPWTPSSRRARGVGVVLKAGAASHGVLTGQSGCPRFRNRGEMSVRCCCPGVRPLSSKFCCRGRQPGPPLCFASAVTEYCTAERAEQEA